LLKGLGGIGNDGGISERDILYKVLFDMRKDVTELKKLVLAMLQGGQINAEVINQHQDLFNGITKEESLIVPQQPAIIQPSQPIFPTYHQSPIQHFDDTNLKIDNINRIDIEDISHETEEEIFSLDKKEKEMIIKALRKNNFKRKYAAQDLGISERTLYRKINQYDIADE
jgi:DNA-binding NtrC family response regulator